MPSLPNVRVEHREATSEGPAYRSSADAGTHVVVVRGSSPLRARLTLAGLALGALLGAAAGSMGHAVGDLVALALGAGAAQVGMMLLWRKMQTVRLELSRGRLLARSTPLGASVQVDGWAAREPIVVTRWLRWGRPLVTFQEWDVFVESEDGRRSLVCTLLDPASVELVTRTLAESFRDATDAPPRHPFAVRFGALPERVLCEGDPDDPRRPWRVEIACPREGLSGALAVSALAWPLTLISLGLSVFVVVERGSLLAGLCPSLLTLGLGVWSLRLSREVTVRARGLATLELAPGGLTVRASPSRWLFDRGGRRHEDVRGLDVRRGSRQATRGVLWLRTTSGHRRILAELPLDAEDAAYVARIVNTYYGSASEPDAPDRG